MKKLLLAIMTAFVSTLAAYAQFSYRTVASGNWNAITTWERFDASTSTWSAATTGQIPGSLDSVFVQAGHTLTITQNESCLKLALNNASGQRLNLNDFQLEITGTIAAFSNTVATFAFPLTYTSNLNFSIANGTNGSGKIRFTGSTRNLFTPGQWGANPANWNCEFALNNGEIGTLPGNFKAGRITLFSGTIIANNDLRPDAGTNSGDLVINSGATLRVTGSISRTGTLTATIDSIDVSGTLELAGSSTTQNFSTVNLRVNNGGRIVKINNNALITTITNRTWATGSTLEYAGTANQTVGGEFPGTLPKVVINNSGVGSAVTFNGSRYIADTLIMTSGNILIGATDSLTLGINSTGTLLHTSGNIIGKFNRFISSSTTGNILYPLGTTTTYCPVNVNFIAAPISGGNASISYVDNGNNNQTITPFTDGGLSIDRISQSYWAGSINNGLLATNITLSCTLTNQQGITNSALTRVVGSTDNGTTYGSLGGSHISGSGFSASRTGFQVNSPLNFRLHLGGNSISNPLPVVIKSFTASKGDNGVNLKWSTASESNNKGFEVQRSVNGAKYQTVGFVKGNGNSNVVKTYSFTDANSTTGNICYRLKQIDFNGASEFSKVVCVNVELEKTTGVFTTPNPFNGSLHLKYNSATEGTANVQIIDMLGKSHQNTNMIVNKGENTLTLDTDALPVGIYFIRVTNGAEVTTQRIVKK